MTNFQKPEEAVLAAVRAESAELDLLHAVLYAKGRIRREQADVLVELHRRVDHPSPAFRRFFYRGIKDHVLAQARINAEQAAWLRQLLITDGTIMKGGRAFLLQLKGEAKWVSPAFEQLFEEFTK